MIAQDEIHKAVLNALTDIAPETDASALDPKAPLREALDLDSMDFLNFITAIHEALHVDIPERDYPRMQTLDSAIAYLKTRLA
jgi:acyl carrier protein